MMYFFYSLIFSDGLKKDVQHSQEFSFYTFMVNNSLALVKQIKDLMFVMWETRKESGEILMDREGYKIFILIITIIATIY